MDIAAPVASDFEEAAAAPGSSRQSPVNAIRRRVILLGLPLSLLAFWLVVRMECVDQTGLPTGLAIYYHAVVFLAVLCLVNSAVLAYRQTTIASRAELLCLYSMVSVASSFACWEMLGTQIDVISVPARWLALEGRREPVASLALSLLPHWALVENQQAAVQLFAGRHSAPLRWESWLAPLIAWGGVLAVTQAMTAAGCRLLFERWVHHEKLSFPLTALPMELANPGSPVWRTATFRVTFAIVACMDLINGLHQFLPVLPYIPCKVSWVNDNATSLSWQAVGPWPITFHPLMIGLAFLFPTDLLFSCWFFYLVGKLQLYLSGSFDLAHGSAFEFGSSFPGLLEQNTGAILMFGVLTLRGASGYLADVGRGAIAGNMASRRDIIVIAVGTAVWVVVLLSLGVSWTLTLLALPIAALIGVVVARLRAEMGLPVHNLHGQGPDMLLGNSFGPQQSSLSSLAGLMSLHGLLRSQQGNVMPHQFEGAFMATRVGGPLRRYWAAITLAGAAGALIGPWIYLWAASAHGLTGHGDYNPYPEEGWRQLAKWAYNPSPPDIQSVVLVAVGALVMLGLVELRGVWLGCPFHPLGYAICGGWGLGMIATPLFLAWIAKTLVLRYGGLALYRRAIPVAYAMILGEFVMAIFWAVASIVLKAPTYSVWLF